MNPEAKETGSDRTYWEERLREHWSIRGVGYLGYGEYYNRWLYRVRRRILRRVVAGHRWPVATWSVLDVGSGTGFWLDTWRALGARELTGCDLTEVAVARLKTAFPAVPVFQADVAEEAFVRELKWPFDAVSAFDVLFHITEDCRFDRAIGNVAKVLRSGGLFLFSDNFVHQPAVRLSHQVSRPLAEVSACLDRHGFDIVARQPMFVVMNAPVDTNSAWSMLVWRAFMAPVRILPVLGYAYGAVLMPCDLALTALRSESPSTELMICRKR